VSLKGLNASNNQFTRLNRIFSLPNKNKVEKINFFGNQIKEVDLARLFAEFPNLKYLNLDYIPYQRKT
jgi:Leucine-rich repeat (LRR) protein